MNIAFEDLRTSVLKHMFRSKSNKNRNKYGIYIAVNITLSFFKA